MSERFVSLTDQEIQRIEAIITDRDKEEALKFLREMVRKKLRSREGHACGPKPI